jgi:hypothetical protein
MILLIWIYLVGAVLSYGRNLSSYYCTYRENKWLFNSQWEEFKTSLIKLSLLSWLGFLIGLIPYFADNEEIFLKFNLLEED